MGAWGYFEPPTTPPDNAWEDMAEQESLEEFVEQEMSYEDAMAEYYGDRPEDYIATDEGGWEESYE